MWFLYFSRDTLQVHVHRIHLLVECSKGLKKYLRQSTIFTFTFCVLLSLLSDFSALFSLCFVCLFVCLFFDNEDSKPIVSPFFKPPPGQEYEKINAIQGNL